MRNILFAILLSGCVGSPAVQRVEHTVESDSVHHISTTDTIRLVFAGDVMVHGMQITGAWRDGGDSCYNFHHTFEWTKDYISAADIAVANLEVTLAGPPYEGYPSFSSPQSLAYALQDAGFDVLLTANNHSLDRDKTGLERTLDVLDSIGMLHTGTFRDSTEWIANYPMMIERNNFRIALLNYTYGTNNRQVEVPNVVNFIDTLRMAADIAKARELNSDYIIVCIHWGDEYENEENETQRQLAAFLAKRGCNLIVGAHPHVIQPLAKLPVCGGDTAIVAYSIGNFISNMRKQYRDGGITLEITLTKTDGIITLQSVGYESFWVYRYPKNGVQVFRLIRINDYLNSPERYPAITEYNKNVMMQFYENAKIMINDQ